MTKENFPERPQDETSAETQSDQHNSDQQEPEHPKSPEASTASTDAWPMRQLKQAAAELYAAPREELIRFLETEDSVYVSQRAADGLRHGRPIEMHGVHFFEDPLTRSGAASDILKLVPIIGRETILEKLKESTHQ